ncbi:MAG: ribose-5-phosphate isomerase RpiA [Candidatus Hodarchaeota archaeon]
MTNEKAKRLAAEEAIKHVKDGDIVGMGSGTTIAHVIELLGERVKRDGINISAVPSSHQSAHQLIENDIPLTSLDEHPSLDIAIDGADEVDRALNLIKGGGAALTREKIVGAAATNLIIVIDSSKLSDGLGGVPVPVEVLPFAYNFVKRKMQEMGGKVSLRNANRKLGPVITDNGNFILDVKFDEIDEPSLLERELNNIPGVIENGIFSGLADIVYIGYADRVEKLEKT